MNPEIDRLPYGTHCAHCGVKHAADADWPRTCVNKHTMWNSVPTVGVALLPIAMPPNPYETYDSAMRNRSWGLAGVRRDIQPQRGTITLPGGYLNGPHKSAPQGETWQQAVVRELREESAGLIDLPASEVEEWMVRSSTDGRHCLVFGILKPRELEWFEEKRARFAALPKESKEKAESLELALIRGVAEPLGFPTHQEAAEKFFAKYRAV